MITSSRHGRAILDATEPSHRDNPTARGIKDDYRRYFDETRRYQEEAVQAAAGARAGPELRVEHDASGLTRVTMREATVEYSQDFTRITRADGSLELRGPRLMRSAGERVERYDLMGGLAQCETVAGNSRSVIQVLPDGSTETDAFSNGYPLGRRREPGGK